MKKCCLKLAIDFSSGVILVKYFETGGFLSNLEIDKSTSCFHKSRFIFSVLSFPPCKFMN